MIRVHRYRDAVTVTDITNAGKAGKVCRELHVDMWCASGSVTLPGSLAHIPIGDTEILYVPYNTVLAALGAIPTNRGSERTIKGVHVAPADFAPIAASGERVSICVDFDRFSVSDRTDRINETTAIPHHKGRATSIKRAHAWLRENADRVPSMSFSELTDALVAAGVRLHVYCGVD